VTSQEALEKICQKIIKMDPKVRSARIINSRGHLIAGGMKVGLQSLESQKQDEMMFMELALRVRMRHEFDKEFGEVHFSMSYRDKVIVMSFPLAEDGVLLVSLEKDADFGKIAFKILKLIAPLKKPVLGTF
jgi:exopolyphosphatase/pppGpp-phosphohydrolase